MRNQNQLITKQQDLIDEVMDNFNFHKVVKVMEVLNWNYPLNPAFEYNEHFLRPHVRGLLKKVMDEGIYNYECGGWRIKYDKKDQELECLFVAEGWYTGY